MPDIVIGRDFKDLKRFGKIGTLKIGKHIVGTGEDAHLTSPILVDALRPHCMIICGKRGGGKSYTLGVIVEELKKLRKDVRKNLCSLVIDTQGIFWTMKYPNESDSDLLKAWNLKPMGIDVKVYIPYGQKEMFEKAGVKFDGTFSISASQLDPDDWLYVFNIDINDMSGILIERVITRMKKSGKKYGIDDIINEIKREEGFGKEKLLLENRFLAAKMWGIFGEDAMPKILEPEKSTVLDVSMTPSNIRSVLVSIVLKKVLEERIKARRLEELAKVENEEIKRVPLCWIVIDEAHNFVPNKGKVASSDILLRIVKEGRQPGVSTIFATQRPNKLHPDVIAQSDLIISHRLTAKSDIEALKAIMQTYMLFDIEKYLNDLPRMKGVALVLDDNSERLYKIQVRPRQSWHAGSSPIAIDEDTFNFQ